MPDTQVLLKYIHADLLSRRAGTGKVPWRSWGVQQRQLAPAGIRCGIGRIGWHTFRHTFRSLLDETGARMKVQQELMRHADIRTTMNVRQSHGHE
jgi:integrase